MRRSHKSGRRRSDEQDRSGLAVADAPQGGRSPRTHPGRQARRGAARRSRPRLSHQEAPPFACDAIVILSPEKAAQGVDIVTSNGILLMTMGEILGYKELQPEKVESKVRFK